MMMMEAKMSDTTPKLFCFFVHRQLRYGHNWCLLSTLMSNDNIYPGFSTDHMSHLHHEYIKVGLRELEDILNNDLSTQMHKVKPRNPKKRQVTSEGVTIQGLCDIVYINLSIPLTLAEKKNKVLKKTPKPIKYAFLVAIDVLSR